MTIKGFTVGDEIEMVVREGQLLPTQPRKFEVKDVYPYFLKARDIETDQVVSFNYGDLVANGYYERMLQALI